MSTHCLAVNVPISSAINDLVCELYGFAVMRRLVLLGFLGNLLAVLAIAIAGRWPAPAFWTGQDAYRAILGQAWRRRRRRRRRRLASFTAYLVGQFSNAWVFAALRRRTGPRHLWLRALCSTAVGEGLDTLLFLPIAFAGVWPAPAPGAAAVAQWSLKVLYEAAALPATYLLVRRLRLRHPARLAVPPPQPEPSSPPPPPADDMPTE